MSDDHWVTSSVFDANSQHAPKPQQAIQYYRASSTVLTLDGYNNSATFSSNESASDSPLPQNIDTKFLECLNQTIGSAVPLVEVPPETWMMQHQWIGIIITFGSVFMIIAIGLGVLTPTFVKLLLGIRWITNLVANVFAYLYSKMQSGVAFFVINCSSGMTVRTSGTTGPQVNDWSSVEE